MVDVTDVMPKMLISSLRKWSQTGLGALLTFSEMVKVNRKFNISTEFVLVCSGRQEGSLFSPSFISEAFVESSTCLSYTRSIKYIYLLFSPGCFLDDFEVGENSRESPTKRILPSCSVLKVCSFFQAA